MNVFSSHRFWSLFCPFISTYLITLNVYNGDIFNIEQDINKDDIFDMVYSTIIN